MEQFNPGLRNLVNLGKNYEKSVAGEHCPSIIKHTIALNIEKHVFVIRRLKARSNTEIIFLRIIKKTQPRLIKCVYFRCFSVIWESDKH